MDKAEYRRLRAEHRCGTCGGQDERTLAGGATCKVCLLWKQEYARERYQNCADFGLCPKCRKPVSGQRICAECLAKARARRHERREVNP